MANNRVVLGISASVAIYKSLEVISILKKRGFEVRVAMTDNAAKMISPLVFKALTNNEVYKDVMEELELGETNITHVALAEWGDVFGVVPATANIISQIACGLSRDPVSLLACATDAKKVLAPAMNTKMYLNPIIQKHIEFLKSLGWLVVEPIEGELACNTKGVGHIAREEHIADAIESCFYPKLLNKKKVVVTAGPTLEAIDPVRFLTNRSSGKMGFALAKMAQYLGAEVVLITGKTCLETPFNVRRVDCESTEDMLHALREEVDRNDELIVIMSAAIADFKPARIESKKIKKNGNGSFVLKLVENPDVTAVINRYAKSKGKKIRLVGFAAETDDLLENARVKIEKKGLEFIVANDVGRSDIGFGSDENEVVIIYRDGRIERVDKANKLKIAYEILRRLA